MKNTPGNHGIFGELKTQKMARAALPVIILRAQERRTITFQELGKVAGIKNVRRQGGQVCDRINTTLYELEKRDDWEFGEIPHLTSIVIKKTEEPSNWMLNHITTESNIPPSWEEYETNYVQPVLEYPHWDKVMLIIVEDL